MLVTQNGGYVLGKDVTTGELSPMKLGTGKVSVDEKGNVSVDSNLKYSIPLYDFDDYNSLEKLGNNMYGIKDNNTVPRIMDAGNYTISQGKLEQSNVDITSEMVSMITNLRSYQANQRVLQAIDETLGKTVNEVGALK
jgi:flagellar basal-body rod protein FlgG